ncbi:uncharacterized protein LOC105288073 isoform X3 [Ooceraea biroi]|uniref:uncharacterized protein LOC105288073 isoform X3 n=1 Tax=Ooceraea biroi TaxID=2015173 RepID=UPI000F07737C|nr:uncharacterized protein LOC105288073 isoform X3 [Ooceraea biroi]
MATISFLGEDMILHILRTNDISIKDVNFSSTCKHFRDMIESSNSCWRWKCCQRWSKLEKGCKKEMHKGVKYINFKELTKAGIKCAKELRHFLTQMNRKFYHQIPERDNSGYIDIYYDYREDPRFHDINYDNNYININEDIHLLIHPDETAHPLSNYYFLISELTNLLERSESCWKRRQLFSHNGINSTKTSLFTYTEGTR